MRNDEYSWTNIFAKALYDRFFQLDIGAPNEKIIDAIERAGDEITQEVKQLMNEQHKLRNAKKQKAENEFSGS